MPRNHWTTYLWPGLSRLWVGGSWVGLAVAVGFTVLANSLLLATLVYHDWMAADVQLTGYGMLVVLWLLAWWESRADRRREAVELASGEPADGVTIDKRAEEREAGFREAQQCYLRGDWVAAEQKLLKLLKQDARDVESRLMLATLWRHQGRDEEALRQLDRLERLEAAAEWKYEIAVEREALISKKLAIKKQDAPPERDDNTNENTPTDDTDRRMAA